MAITASGLFVPTLVNALTNAIPLDLNSESNIKLALISDSATPNFDTHDYWNDLSANEVTGTGWAAGGVVLTSTTLSAASGALVFDAGNVSASSTTLSNPMAAVIYDAGVTTPTANALVCLIDFVTTYPTSNGTFAITWSTSPDCIFSLDVTP
jgi:hypothetical protein